MKIDNHVLYGLRLIVLMEDSPQSNNYRQIRLDEEKFKAIGNVIWGGPAKEGLREDEKDILMSQDTYPLPDLQQIHDENRR